MNTATDYLSRIFGYRILGVSNSRAVDSPRRHPPVEDEGIIVYVLCMFTSASIETFYMDNLVIDCGQSSDAVIIYFVSSGLTDIECWQLMS
jgi:hypothetical protein